MKKKKNIVEKANLKWKYDQRENTMKNKNDRKYTERKRRRWYYKNDEEKGNIINDIRSKK